MRNGTLLVGLALGLLPFGSGSAGAATASAIQYATMDDGIKIAVRIFFPDTYDGSRTYPALLEMEGYGGAGSPNDTTFINDPDYVVVAASIRGTGCSGAQLDLFSDRSSLDGKEIIDTWLPTQSWWNGKAGIYGHSYSGLTGFLIAAQNPTNLTAVAVSGLIDDFYRGILYPGGVPNPGFPVLWGGLLRPESEYSGNANQAAFLSADPQCLENLVQHQGSDLFAYQTLIDTYTQRQATPDSWAIQRALLSHINGLRKPIQLGQQYQDEQTGPRGGHVLWQHIPADLPKRIAISTGRHNPNDPTHTKKDWLDCWILFGGDTSKVTTQNHSCADVLDTSQRVMLFFESEGNDRLAPYLSSDWPLPETRWERYYLGADGSLSTDITGGDGAVTYVSTGTGRQLGGDLGGLDPAGSTLGQLTYADDGLPDTARFQLSFTQTTAVAGPIDLTLWATATSADVDFWAEVLDKNLTTGDETFVQRGLLRASFRDVSYDLSDKVASGPHAGEIYRPYHLFVNPTPIVPLQAYQYEVELFPLGHVFRAGHALILQIHAPPANDPISTYAYEPNQPSVVMILQDALHRSSILLPVMSTLPPMRSPAPTCGQVVGEICVTPVLG